MSLWRRFTSVYAALLSWAGRAVRGDPGDPGQLADLLALHGADPLLHLDRGDGALPVHLDHHDRRHDRRARVDAFRGRRVAAAVAARRGHGAARRPARRTGRRAGVRVGRHPVHAVRLEPDLRARRAAAVAHPCRLAGDGRDLDRVPRRADARRSQDHSRGEPHDRRRAVAGGGGADPVRHVLSAHVPARAGGLRAGPRLPADPGHRAAGSTPCR